MNPPFPTKSPPSNGEFDLKSRVGHKVRTQELVVASRKLESENTSRTDHISSIFQYVSMINGYSLKLWRCNDADGDEFLDYHDL